MDRRTFVETVSSAALASRSASPASRLGNIGVQLYTLRQAMEQDFDGTLARVARIGFREVEFAGYFNRTPAQVQAAVNPTNTIQALALYIGDAIKRNLTSLFE